MLLEKLYVVKYKDKDKAVIELADENHPLFRAHFPTMPILPGYVHFEVVSDIFGIKITTIKKAKFLKTITPKQTLTYKKNNNKFKVFLQDEEVANFTL